MRAKLFHHSFEWLAGDFEPPKRLLNEDHLKVYRLHASANGLLAMKIKNGTGVWDRSGSLLFFNERGADLSWSPNTASLFSLENKFGRCQQRRGIRHILRQLDTDTFQTIEEIEICVPTGGVEYLIPANICDHWAASWIEQNEWGYVGVDVKALIQDPMQKAWHTLIMSPPAFSPEDRVIVSCTMPESGWWTDDTDEYWKSPSPGGLRQVGTIVVHTVQSGQVSQHRVLVKLPRGWLPQRPESDTWDLFWGPQFIAEDQFQIWLPDDTVETLRLPLPPDIEIARELKTERPWGDF